ncbi:MAG: hypothetical protein COW63_01240, partial [Bacteroidetes bacterium CG18_big_fil_WC_8_21_14_2_50_41_14]
MQLKRLYIKEYKILKDFTIEFPYDFNKYISVFIGANGSGKSTILEALADILSWAYLNETAKFAFELEYSLKYEDLPNYAHPKSNKNTTRLNIKLIAAQPNTPIQIEIYNQEGVIIYNGTTVDRDFMSFGIGGKDFSVLPENVVIYYSGLSEIMKELCRPHEEKLSKAYRKGNPNINRDFFYYTRDHFEIILLSLLSFEYGDIPEFLRSKAKIAGMQSVQIRLQKPSWSKDTHDNFWGAEGEVRNFLDFLNENSASVDELQNPQESNKKGNIVIEAWQDEAVIITILGLERLYEIREHLIEEKKLFDLLNIMLADGLLEDISFSLIKVEKGNYQNFSILSEGEQQIITIKGLTELLSGKNTLFLFDEPDTYLHPKWQRQFISEIEKTIDSAFESENTFVIATHSPQLLSNAKSDLNFVKIIEDGSLVENTPKYYGREI